jgi:hypothetical protein
MGRDSNLSEDMRSTYLNRKMRSPGRGQIGKQGSLVSGPRARRVGWAGASTSPCGVNRKPKNTNFGKDVHPPLPRRESKMVAHPETEQSQGTIGSKSQGKTHDKAAIGARLAGEI